MIWGVVIEPRLVDFKAETAAIPNSPQVPLLIVAGHTHGGQTRVPFTDDWSWMALESNEEVHADGLD